LPHEEAEEETTREVSGANKGAIVWSYEGAHQCPHDSGGSSIFKYRWRHWCGKCNSSRLADCLANWLANWLAKCCAIGCANA
jgi:hypothetical protein